MKKSQLRFDFFLSQLRELLVKASKQKNPALWLYRNNARTPLFMLEGLAKLYSGIHNKKKFQKIKEQFKLLEDAIGQIDYYDAFGKELAADKNIPPAITTYLQAQSREKVQSLNEILKEAGWLGEKKTRIDKIRQKLSEADWQTEKEELKNIQRFYITAINKILEFINQKDFHFADLENDMHEFRRMIRWLSIYPQTLRGCVQLSKSKTTKAKYLDKYLTTKITSSPYNIMPDAGDHKHFLLLDQNHFYALSWMIAELGSLKDRGLKVEVIKEAILQTSKTNEKDALANAYQLCGAEQKKIEELLTTASSLCKTYCKEKNLEQLIKGTASVK